MEIYLWKLPIIVCFHLFLLQVHFDYTLNKNRTSYTSIIIINWATPLTEYRLQGRK